MDLIIEIVQTQKVIPFSCPKNETVSNFKKDLEKYLKYDYLMLFYNGYWMEDKELLTFYGVRQSSRIFVEVVKDEWKDHFHFQNFQPIRIENTIVIHDIGSTPKKENILDIMKDILHQKVSPDMLNQPICYKDCPRETMCFIEFKDEKHTREMLRSRINIRGKPVKISMYRQHKGRGN